MQEGDGKAMPCGGRDLHRTRGLVFPMVRFGRMYEGDHVHLVFRKPVAEFHALTTEVLIVPQRHNSCDYDPSPHTNSHSLCEQFNVYPVAQMSESMCDPRGGTSVVGGGLRGRFRSFVSQRSHASKSIKLRYVL